MTTLDEPKAPDPMDPDELVREAERRARFGGTAAALDLFREALKENPRHADALRGSARLTTDTDQANNYYRRASVLDALEAEDFLRWAALLLVAKPSRPKQAVDVVHRLRTRYPQRSDMLAHAAIMLADFGEWTSAESVVDAIADLRSLPEELTHGLMRLAGGLLEDQRPWRDQYWDRAGLIEELTSEGHPRTVLEAARLACRHGDHSRAKEFLDNIDEPQPNPVMQLATELRAVVAANDDDHDEVIRNVELLPGVSNGWLRLIYAAALHEVGRFDAAERQLRRLESESDRQLKVRGLLSRITLLYSRADFDGYWKAIQDSARIDPSDLPPVAKAVIVNCRTVLDHATSYSALLQINDLLETPDLGHTDASVLRLTRAEIFLRMARHSATRQRDAELAVRETLSHLRKKLGPPDRGTYRPNCVEAAFLALLVDDDDIALSLLNSVDPSGNRWRVRTLEAIVMLRKSRSAEAVALLDGVVEQRRHDLDRRCLHVQAELAAGRVDDALRDAANVVQFAPEHVTGRLLHAEALFMVAGEPSEKRTEDYPRLIQAACEYAEVLQLHQRLTVLIAGGDPGGRVGSELLPDTTRKHVARQCVTAAVRATWALSQAGLPADESVERCAEVALNVLAEGNENEEKRFKKLFNRPRNRIRRHRAGRGTAYALSAAFGTMALLVEPSITEPGAMTALRIALFVVAGVALLWPHIQKLTIGWFGVERNQAVLTPPSSGDVLPAGAAGTPRLFGRLLTPSALPWLPPAYDKPFTDWSNMPLTSASVESTLGPTSAVEGTEVTRLRIPAPRG